MSGLQNGELMQRAAKRCDVFVTMDANLPHQQNMGLLPFAVIIVKAYSNRLLRLRPLVGELLAASSDALPTRSPQAAAATEVRESG